MSKMDYPPVKVLQAEQLALEALDDALKETWSHRRASADELWQFAKVCRVAQVMRLYLAALGQAVP